MYKGKKIGVVVPAYEEEGFVGGVIETVPSFVDRVYVIDDGSTDGTWREIREAARRENDAHTRAMTSGGTAVFERPVVPLRNEKNRGVGGSIKHGYARALQDDIDVVAVMNGDGQMDPAILDRIVDPVVEGRADFAKGNRLLFREFREGMSRWRFFGNSILTLLTKVASGYWKTMDPQNGYTAISAETLETIEYERLYEDYGFCNDMLIALNVRGMRVADVAMPARYGDERSTIVYSRFVPRLSKLLAHRFLWRLKVKYLVFDFHPFVLLYGLGALASALGLAALAQSARSARRDGAFDRLLASLSLFFGGAAMLVAAMTVDMRENEHLEEQIHE
ncbi:glycosyltransferase family 2 protein [Halalkalicoccus sp. NIPERK01]|uniref:glycosyltransferase family 2 protein n=1 Tax=Halalkalicoccus sp. NIPERK01 TaxID=3053469 RepID=UPI00256ED727|nr:glycosyltransferase family 2 protein [Halalkalicoccus sp. NIPERK01]MDL5360621.1 glycosyltransferase family 2 protein [Halalkalicoccus sp. NIPERK01]